MSTGCKANVKQQSLERGVIPRTGGVPSLRDGGPRQADYNVRGGGETRRMRPRSRRRGLRQGAPRPRGAKVLRGSTSHRRCPAQQAYGEIRCATRSASAGSEPPSTPSSPTRSPRNTIGIRTRRAVSGAPASGPSSSVSPSTNQIPAQAQPLSTSCCHNRAKHVVGVAAGGHDLVDAHSSRSLALEGAHGGPVASRGSGTASRRRGRRARASGARSP